MADAPPTAGGAAPVPTYKIRDGMAAEIAAVSEWRSLNRNSGVGIKPARRSQSLTLSVPESGLGWVPSQTTQEINAPSVSLAKETSDRLYPTISTLWETCRRTGGCGAGDDGAAAEDPPPFDPSKVWVDGLRKIRLKTATFGKMADPEEDRVNPIRPEQWPEDDAPTTVQRLATEIRAGIITKEMMSKMSWAIVYGGVRLGHSADEPNVYTSFGNSGMLPTFHDPEDIQLDDPMWTAAVARGAATSHDGQYALSGESEEAVRACLAAAGEQGALETLGDGKAPGKMRWDDGQLRFTRQVHGTDTIKFKVQDFTLRVMVFSPINPAPWTVFPYHQWLGFLVWDVDTLICDKGTADERTIHLAPITLQDGSVCFPVPHEDALRDAGLDIAEVYGALQVAVAERSEGRLIVVSAQNLSTATVAWTHFHIISAEALDGLRLMTKGFVNYLTGKSPVSPTGSCFNNRHAVALAAMSAGGIPDGPSGDIIKAFRDNENVHKIRSWKTLINPRATMIVSSLHRYKKQNSVVETSPVLVHAPTTAAVEALLIKVHEAVGGLLGGLPAPPSSSSPADQASAARRLLSVFGWGSGSAYLAHFGRSHVMLIDLFFNDRDDALAVMMAVLLVAAACRDEMNCAPDQPTGPLVPGTVRLDARFVACEFSRELGVECHAATTRLGVLLGNLAAALFGADTSVLTIDVVALTPAAPAPEPGDPYAWADAETPEDEPSTDLTVGCVWVLSGFRQVFLDDLRIWSIAACERGEQLWVIDGSAVAWEPRPFGEPSNLRQGWSPGLDDGLLYQHNENLTDRYLLGLERYCDFARTFGADADGNSIRPAMRHVSVSMIRDVGHSAELNIEGGASLYLHGRPVKWHRAADKDGGGLDTATSLRLDPGGGSGLEAAFRLLLAGLLKFDIELADLCFRPVPDGDTRGCSAADSICVTVASMRQDQPPGRPKRQSGKSIKLAGDVGVSEAAGPAEVGPWLVHRELELRHGKSEVEARRQSSWTLHNHRQSSLRSNRSNSTHRARSGTPTLTRPSAVSRSSSSTPSPVSKSKSSI